LSVFSCQLPESNGQPVADTPCMEIILSRTATQQISGHPAQAQRTRIPTPPPPARRGSPCPWSPPDHRSPTTDNWMGWTTWWSSRGARTRSHPELGRENPQRPWYCVSRHGRVGRRQVFQPIQQPNQATVKYRQYTTPKPTSLNNTSRSPIIHHQSPSRGGAAR
jgi:hypothetical protein